MSITFFSATPEGRPLHRCSCDHDGAVEFLMTCPACESGVNLGNTNAFELLRWLGLVPNSVGDAPARDLAARCRRRLWAEERNEDPALSAGDRLAALGASRRGARVVMFGRDAGYLRHQTERLLAVAELAGDGLVCWG